MMKPDKRQSWLMMMIDSASYVKGDTRLQKYALVMSKAILEGLYDDWKAHRYGAYSSRLRSDVDQLLELGLLLAHDIHDSTVYTLSGKGKEALQPFKEECLAKYDGEMSEIKKVLDHYQCKTVEILVDDTCRQFPEYTTNNRTKDQAGDIILRDMLGYDLAPSGKGTWPAASNAKPEIRPPGNGEFRIELARSIGMDGPPPLDIRAYDELAKMFAGRTLQDVETEDELAQ